MRRLIALFSLATFLQSTPVSAYDWSIVGAKVTAIEVTYAPYQIPFRIDRAAGNCAAGTFLKWNAKGNDSAAQAQNYQAVLAVLLTAKGTGQPIQIYGNNSDCSIDFLYIISS